MHNTPYLDISKAAGEPTEYSLHQLTHDDVIILIALLNDKANEIKHKNKLSVGLAQVPARICTLANIVKAEFYGHKTRSIFKSITQVKS